MSTSQVNYRLERAYDRIVKSSQDKREYRGLLLDNGLKCLLISDPSTDRSAAAVYKYMMLKNLCLFWL